MKIFSAAQLHEADAATAEKQNISQLQLMERAGNQLYAWLHKRLKGAPVQVHIFCGIGNNGGDGLVVGRLLIENGYNVNIYIANFTQKRSKCFLINYDRVKKVTKKWPVLMTSEADFPKITAKDIAIDALFGIGLNRPPEGWVKKLVQHINRSSAFTLSIDIPSGLFANKPGTDPTAVVKPNHTLTFQTPKLSFFLPGTGKFVPHFEVIDIGLDQEYLHTTQPLAQLITKAAARNFYKQREKYTHKGTYGHSLIIAGSYGKMGAAVLAARAAARAGSGLVSVFVPQCGYETLQTSFPEAMVFTDAEPGVISKIEFDIKPTSTAIGMGIGTNGLTEKALREFLKKTNYPIVIDADALNIISKKKTLQKLIPKNSILTPHPGELKRLIGPWADDFEKIEKTKKLATALNAIVVVKGADTLTVFNGQLYINASGNPGMATGGTGDALAGVLCGLLAQGYDPLIAAVFGVYLHGSSGNIASQQQGFEAMIASDVIANLGPAFLELFAPNAEERQKKQG